jgi:hypothetical protein
LPGFFDSQKDDTSGTWAPPQAGLGLATVRAQSHAMTVNSFPTYSFRSGLPAAISSVTLTGGYRCPMRLNASSRIHRP